MDFPAVELVPGGYLSSSLAPVSLQTPQNHSETFSWVWSNSICPCSLPAPPQELQVIKWVIPHSQEFIQNAFSTTSSIASTSRPFAAGTCPAVARSTAWQSSFIPFPAILDLSLSPGMMIGALAPHGRPPRLPGSGLRHSKDMEDGNGFTNIYIYVYMYIYIYISVCVCMCIYIYSIYIYDIYIYDKSYTCMICISCFSCSRNLPRFLYTLPFWSRSSRKPGTLAFGVFFQCCPYTSAKNSNQWIFAPIEHHPTIGDISSPTDMGRWCSKSPKRDIYQPLLDLAKIVPQTPIRAPIPLP